jgi:hypothetical protein
LWFAAVLVALVTIDARAIFVRPDVEDVPTDRIIANLEQQVAANPKDAALQARLARFHALVYAQGSDRLPVDRRSGQPWEGRGVPTPPAVISPADNARRAHLSKALVHYKESLAIAPDDVVVRLGYAWAVDQSGDRDTAVREYRSVIERAWAKEKDKRALMPSEVSIAVEAGGYLERRLDPVKDKAEIDAIHERRAQISRLPRAITPIVVPLRDSVTIHTAVNPDARVAFDADGSALPGRWTWISRDVAWLVFDPRSTGRITSALQLFGSVTFWAFWRDGYEALAALDDDASGELRGAELNGLALWADRNADGISDDGEVLPLGSYGIIAVSTHAEPTCHPDVVAVSPRGVEYANGTHRATYDVILHSERPPM